MQETRLPTWARLIVFTSTIVVVVEYARSDYDFGKDFDVTWGDGRAKVLEDGQLLTLSLDQNSGSGVRSKHPFLFGKFQMQMKLVPGNSIGTITTFYLSSMGGFHDEVDMEFLGNRTGNECILHTNVFTQGKGNREQQFNLWFDPTKDFHTYSILWNQQVIILSVDGIPIREFKNLKPKGIPYPKYQPMWVYGSIWNSSGWATHFGHVGTNWSYAPFTASYRNFSVHSYCAWSVDSSSCSPTDADDDDFWLKQSLDTVGREQLNWVRSKYMIYDYCSDTKRFRPGVHPECTLST